MRIFAVDDEPAALNLLRSCLKKACPKDELYFFSDPEELLLEAKGKKIDIAFLDINMGGMNGLDVAKSLQRQNPNINIVFVTGYEEYMPKALSLHASGYVLKPYTQEDIDNELENLINPVASSKQKNLALFSTSLSDLDWLEGMLLKNDTVQDYGFNIKKFYSILQIQEEMRTKGNFDAYIIDVSSTANQGIELAKWIRSKEDNTPMVFIAEDDKYMSLGFEYGVLHYLKKPLDVNGINELMLRISANFEDKKPRVLTVKSPDGEHRIIIKDIMYVLREDRALCYHLKDGSTVMSQKLRGSFLEAIEALLKEDSFYITGSTCLVNMAHIASFNGNCALMSNGEKLFPPERMVSDLKKNWKVYLGK